MTFPSFVPRAWTLGVLLFATVVARPSLGADAEPTQLDVKEASVEGRFDGDSAKLVIQATLGGVPGKSTTSLWGARLEQSVRVTRSRLFHTFEVQIEAIRGTLQEVVLPIGGEGEVKSVSGDGLQDWGLRLGTNGTRSLVLRMRAAEPPLTRFRGRVLAETAVGALPTTVGVLTLQSEVAMLGGGYLRVDSPAELDLQFTNRVGLVSVDTNALPEPLRKSPDFGGGAGRSHAFRHHGEPYAVSVRLGLSEPEAREVVLTDFGMVGELSDAAAAFTLSGVARVRNPNGGTLDLLSGGVALGDVAAGDGWAVDFAQGRFRLVLRRPGDFPFSVKFYAAVRVEDGWNGVEFRAAAGALAPVVLRGLSADTQVRLADAARPERRGEEFASFLPGSGRVKLSWRQARTETEGRLFYAAEAVTQIAVSPGLMRQTTLLEAKVLQGELGRLELRLAGEGEVTRVQGAQVLSWEVEAIPGSTERRLWVRFNQPQKDQVSLQLQIQRSLGAFPLAFDAVRVRPEGATRYGGFLRVVNQGAVRLEVVGSSGLSQISPEQFVQTEATRALLPAQTTQIFAYRFAGGDAGLRVQADNILPELSVSQVLVHRLAETELSVEGEFEVDVREAPLRELVMRVPKGYSLARLTASGLSDHFLTEPADAPDAQLRLVYGAPVIGRQVVQLRMERNQPWTGARWALPRVDIPKARSVRGHVGVVAEAGFRVTPAQLTALTELAPAFFPKKIPGLQLAFRFADDTWTAAFGVERLAQSIQVDALHLFSVGEGIAYGSSLLNYVVSGAPVSTLRVELSSEYFNVEFTGKNIRNWQKVDRGYQVQLHTPVAGTYTLLATYERPFKSQGETLAFTGARPVEAQTEQGYTLVVSTYQFQVSPVSVTGSLTPIETGEVPAEYRLLFDAPILAAYRYAARPYNLQLELRPLAQGDTVGQVVDRAALVTRISDEGQVVTEARYFVKNKGSPNLRLRVPEGAELWSVTLDGTAVVPVKDAQGSFIPLPHRPDPNVVSQLQVKIATKARNPRRLTVEAPVVAAPVLLAEWQIEPAGGRRLVYTGGTLTPAEGRVDTSGFAGLARLSRTTEGANPGLLWLIALLSAVLAVVILSNAGRGGARRFGIRHCITGALGLAAAAVAGSTLLNLHELAEKAAVTPLPTLRFVAPVQQPDVAWRVALENVTVDTWGFGARSWVLAALAVVLFLGALTRGTGWSRRGVIALAWTVLAWAALGATNGAPLFVGVVMAFAVFHALLPGLWRWWQVRGSGGSGGRSGEGSAATAGAGLAMLVGVGLLLGSPSSGAQSANAAPQAAKAVAPVTVPAPVPTVNLNGVEWVDHEIRVEDDFAFGTTRIRWRATQGQTLALFREPGVLTRCSHPTELVRLITATQDGQRRQLLVAERDGLVEFPLEYQVRVTTRDGERGFPIPVHPGLVHRARVTLRGLEMDVFSPQAVLAKRESGGDTNSTVASLVLAPAVDSWIGWRPRTRDTRREKAVFFAELAQLFVPGPGVIEGWHDVRIRPARGEVSELVLEVPAGMTITDVVSPALALWRFDPDTRRLRVGLSPSQSRPFALQVKSQVSTVPLPFERAAGLLVVEGAAGQIGLIGVGTGNEVQLDEVKAEGFSVINLEDFPAEVVQPLAAQISGLTVRRAFRYSAAQGNLTLKASPVEPDVRVESQQTLSLGEDRLVLAATLSVDVLRAGIFRLSFPLPTGLEVESVAGGALSHWTESRSNAARVVTMHLKGKTEGKQQFTVTLTGAGVRSTNAWLVPRLSIREAAKQRGQLVVVPEQGLRLQVGNREGLAQVDPQQAGIRQKGVLAFRLLQDAWSLTLDLERVDAWIQVTGLQHFSLAEAQIKVAANLQYEIENTGVKSLVVRLPAAAENVRFRGEQLTDFLARGGNTNAPTRDWEVKLERRVLGRYVLHVAYTLPLSEQAAEVNLEGVQVQDVNLQRGFVAVQAGGRLQTRAEGVTGLQPTEWQVIPRLFLQDLGSVSANHTFRLVEPNFRLGLKLERRDAARLLPARVNAVTLTSVISDDGAMLTQVRMQLVPGDKRLLHLTLPERARFWFAFVNGNSVWPWMATNQILVPLEQNSRVGESTSVEFFFSNSAGRAGSDNLDLRLAAPKFDLPLENIVWNVHLNEKWRVRKWDGSLQWKEEASAQGAAALDLDSYIRNENEIRQSKTKEAEQFLSLANTLVQQGDPSQARRAFRAAYGMSQHDQAFNEDARVQWNNLKLQQALVGLNVRQARVAGESSAQAATPKAVWDNATANYSQGEAKQLLERNSAEENAVQQRLAERLIQQQDAAVANPAAIRAAIPEQGRRITFTRPLEVNTWTELHVDLRARQEGILPATTRLGILVLCLGGLALLVFAARKRDETNV